MSKFFPEGILINTSENKYYTGSLDMITEAMHEGRILEAEVKLCDSAHNLIVDLNGIRGVIPRLEACVGIRENTVRDIAIISRVHRPVCFIITGTERDELGMPYFILSRREAQIRCRENYIDALTPGDVINARVTHLRQFGAFADIGCGIAALMPIDSMSVSRIEHPAQRFTTGMDIRAVVKSKTFATTDSGAQQLRICLSHKELLGTWQENAFMFSIGETVTGVVRSVEDYGAFVELTPNLAGLAELKDGLEVGMVVSVYIKNIIPTKMKIKLVVIDTFDTENPPETPRYFFDGTHMDEFVYSPSECEKVVTSVFRE